MEMKVGARVSADTKAKLHSARDALKEACACPECMPGDAAKSFVAKFADALGLTPNDYAGLECQDIQSAGMVLSGLANLAASESRQDEPLDVKKLCDLMRGLVLFIGSEIDELEAAGGNVAEETAEPETKASRIAIPNYIKSLHLDYDEQKFRDVLAAKFVGRDEIKHYVFLWGDPQRVDLEADFFTSSKSALGATDFWDGKMGMPKPLTWNHAQDRALMKGTQVIGDTVEYHDDDIGRFANSVLNRSNAYRKVIDEMIGTRMLGTSSDSAPQYVTRERQKNGTNWIKEWAWFASALTDVPCEYRMLDIGSPIWKTIGVDAKWIHRDAEAGLNAARGTMQSQLAEYELMKLKSAE